MAATMHSKTLHRVIVYGILLVAAFFFLAPLYVMLATSFKDADQIRNGNLMSLPTSLNFESWQLAWSTACTGVDCRGLKPYFWNSVAMAVPAVLISTLWGAINGYVLSMWKFKGSDVLFGFMLFGVFMPFQVVLLPMSQVLGFLGLSSSIWGLILVHCLAGIAGTTLFFRNYYTAIPREPFPPEMQAARDKVLAASRRNGLAFLEGCTVENIRQRVDEGVRVIAGGREEVASLGRTWQKRAMPV